MSDPGSALPWAIPVAREVVNNRGLIKRAFEEALNLAFGKRCAVVFTGAAGAGKTVLRDHLVGSAFQRGYVPPGESANVERGRVRDVSDQRVRVAVVPGQDAAPRRRAMDELFLGDKPADGLIYVVSNGFTTVRGARARELVRERGLDTLELFRSYQLAQEVEDLRETLEIVRRSMAKDGKPAWMLVAATKADLCPEELGGAEDHYSPGGHGPFVETVESFIYRVGADNFRWGSAPVCASLDEFSWEGETKASALNAQTRDQMLLDFARNLGNYCGSSNG